MTAGAKRFMHWGEDGWRTKRFRPWTREANVIFVTYWRSSRKPFLGGVEAALAMLLNRFAM